MQLFLSLVRTRISDYFFNLEELAGSLLNCAHAHLCDL